MEDLSAPDAAMIMRWLETKFGRVLPSSDGEDVRVCCPFCYARTGREDTKYHFYVNLRRPVAHCFRCEWRGSHISLVMAVEQCSYTQAIAHLDSPVPDVGRFDGLYRGHTPFPQGIARTARPPGYVSLSAVDGVEAGAAYRYLLGRSVPQELIASRFGWVPGSHRVWMLVDAGWWQGRLIVPGEPKYLSPPWAKGDSLWNSDALVGGDIVVCEGVFSAIAVGNTAVALCGKTINAAQADRIMAADLTSVIIMLDADAGQYANDAANALRARDGNVAIRIQYMTSGDPADGLPGSLVTWDWGEKVAHTLLGM